MCNYRSFKVKETKWRNKNRKHKMRKERESLEMKRGKVVFRWISRNLWDTVKAVLRGRFIAIQA